MSAATKQEALLVLNAARAKAQKASEGVRKLAEVPQAFDADFDAAQAYYQRCVREFEEAINDAARFDTSGDD